jgi:hypothetical protein
MFPLSTFLTPHCVGGCCSLRFRHARYCQCGPAERTISACACAAAALDHWSGEMQLISGFDSPVVNEPTVIVEELKKAYFGTNGAC